MAPNPRVLLISKFSSFLDVKVSACKQKTAQTDLMRDQIQHVENVSPVP
jgi:hypothetical protein